MLENILFVIAARSGSKSVPNKNIKSLGGIPLLGYRAKQALKLTSPENVWLSTDSEEYANIGIKFGVTIPFLRPCDLATDSSNSSDVVLHAMNYAIEKNLNYTAIVLLEPTSPFVYYEDLIHAINLLFANDLAESIVATKEVHINSIFIQDENIYLDIVSKNIANIKNINRQNFSKQITPSGGFYISKWDSFLKNKTFYTDRTLSYKLSDTSSLEIDNPIDWDWAEFLISNKKINLNKIF